MTSYTPKEYSLPMSATLMEFYLPLKSLHIISVAFWMAGLITFHQFWPTTVA